MLQPPVRHTQTYLRILSIIILRIGAYYKVKAFITLWGHVIKCVLKLLPTYKGILNLKN